MHFVLKGVKGLEVDGTNSEGGSKREGLGLILDGGGGVGSMAYTSTIFNSLIQSRRIMPMSSSMIPSNVIASPSTLGTT